MTLKRLRKLMANFLRDVPERGHKIFKSPAVKKQADVVSEELYKLWDLMSPGGP